MKYIDKYSQVIIILIEFIHQALKEAQILRSNYFHFKIKKIVIKF